MLRILSTDILEPQREMFWELPNFGKNECIPTVLVTSNAIKFTSVIAFSVKCKNYQQFWQLTMHVLLSANRFGN